MILKPIPTCSCNPQCSCVLITRIRSLYDNDHVLVFLKGLNDIYSTVKSQVLMMDPLPSINKVFSLVIQQERQYLPFEIQALAVKHPQGSAIKKFVPQNKRPLCVHCGREGHTIDKCYQKHGFPNGYKPNKRSRYPNSTNCVEIADFSATTPSAALAPSSISQNPGFQFTQDKYEALLQMIQGLSSSQH